MSDKDVATRIRERIAAISISGPPQEEWNEIAEAIIREELAKVETPAIEQVAKEIAHAWFGGKQDERLLMDKLEYLVRSKFTTSMAPSSCSRCKSMEDALRDLPRWSVGTLGTFESETGPWVKFVHMENAIRALGKKESDK